VPYYSCSALDELGFVRHGFSTRHGGVSALPARSLNLSHVSWDSPERVDENRRRFMSALDLRTATLVTLSQVHSDRVHIIEEKDGRWNRPQADALATTRDSIALGVQTADCFPLLVVDPIARAVASLHAGWRGTLARIVSKTLRAMQLSLGCEPARLLVAIGPAIRHCCFEVGPEVTEAFEMQFPGVPLSEPHPSNAGKFLLDLRQALNLQFAELGVSHSQVFDLEACTRCSQDEFFSYRGEGPKSGRLMAVIARVAE
jgi:polyphenol oxidase